MSRDTTESTKQVMLSYLKTLGYLRSGTSFANGQLNWTFAGQRSGSISFTLYLEDERPRINLKYRTRAWHSNGEWKEMDYSHEMVSVPCRYGGKKWFFRCSVYTNGVYCGRRVRILYSTGDYFACRHCANLTYSSCNMSKRFRSGAFALLDRTFKAEAIYKTLKRTTYRGKPTRKYRRYPELDGSFSLEAETALHSLLNTGRNKLVE